LSLSHRTLRNCCFHLFLWSAWYHATNNINYERTKYLKIWAFWDIVLCNFIVDWCFRGVYCLHHRPDDTGSMLHTCKDSKSMSLSFSSSSLLYATHPRINPAIPSAWLFSTKL
jgi:hypothetical protein